MGGGGVPSGGVTIKYGKRGDLDTEFTPNSRQDLYVNGKKVQSRRINHERKKRACAMRDMRVSRRAL